MGQSELQRRVDEIRLQLDQFAYEYFVLDQPTASDAEYDQLMNELRGIESEHPELVTAESPTQRVGGYTQSDFGEIVHPRPLLSLSNVYNEEELKAWAQRATRFAGTDALEYVTEPKVDGLAVALTYIDGVLDHAATRGNGFVGDEITANIRAIRSVPVKLRQPKHLAMPGTIEIRGEIYMRKSDFEDLNRRMEDRWRQAIHEPAQCRRRLDPPEGSGHHRPTAIAVVCLPNWVCDWHGTSGHAFRMPGMDEGTRIHHIAGCGSPHVGR